MNDDVKTIKKLKDTYERYLFSFPNVVSIGIGYKTVASKKIDKLCIIVGVTKKLPLLQLTLETVIPKLLDDIQTDVVQVGEIRSLQALTEKWRPAPGGVSVGHYMITAGTIGLPVLFKKDGTQVFLSNNHVLANCNSGVLGDEIRQPGKYDGGTSADQIAVLEDYVEINWLETPSGCSVARGVTKCLNGISQALGRKSRFMAIVPQPNPNLVDAALARPLKDADMKNEIVKIGKPASEPNFEPTLDMPLQKTGRTTGFSQSYITQLYATVNVGYSTGMYGPHALFTDQLIADNKNGTFCQPGDSGSSIFDLTKRFTGLLFAGSDTATVINTAKNVFTLLEVELP